ncbi:hypothetical protein NEOLI_003917 [Neolecta irregularis DAH-3]|uniref:Uncharacterized protein n=1 Tax=Neolecta irregularis (strain DAH-3) TaxID=1198029 RepID=A0A1U7LM62_NEOID|nr:hypothetical protein NEOLI_003917 [Neolecta irregularis DAH-3]|eukprot:OLL23729.1 hypothetical protein NEOLI_003917 [Neolecta irregularis DAH-3]
MSVAQDRRVPYLPPEILSRIAELLVEAPLGRRCRWLIDLSLTNSAFLNPCLDKLYEILVVDTAFAIRIIPPNGNRVTTIQLVPGSVLSIAPNEASEHYIIEFLEFTPKVRTVDFFAGSTNVKVALGMLKHVQTMRWLTHNTGVQIYGTDKECRILHKAWKGLRTMEISVSILDSNRLRTILEPRTHLEDLSLLMIRHFTGDHFDVLPPLQKLTLRNLTFPVNQAGNAERGFSRYISTYGDRLVDIQIDRCRCLNLRKLVFKLVGMVDHSRNTKTCPSFRLLQLDTLYIGNVPASVCDLIGIALVDDHLPLLQRMNVVVGSGHNMSIEKKVILDRYWIKEWVTLK